jgi:hypothetical protein
LHHTSTELHTFPELHGTTDARIEPPIIYLPDNISVLDSHELHQIRDMPLSNLQKPNDIYSRVTAAQHTYDLDAVMHVHQASLRQTQQTNWVVIPLTSMATITTLSVLIYFLCNRFRNSYCIMCKTRAAAPSSQPPIESSKSQRSLNFKRWERKVKRLVCIVRVTTAKAMQLQTPQYVRPMERPQECGSLQFYTKTWARILLRYNVATYKSAVSHLRAEMHSLYNV